MQIWTRMCCSLLNVVHMSRFYVSISLPIALNECSFLCANQRDSFYINRSSHSFIIFITGYTGSHNVIYRQCHQASNNSKAVAIDSHVVFIFL